MDYNFDRISDQYDATRGFPPGVAERVCQWVLARLPADPTIAEVGVGTGRIAVPFITRDIRYTGFDISEQMTELLRRKVGGDLRRAQLFMADITEPLPVPDESQDAVMAVHILHLVDAEKALTQIRRILKPNGALVWGYEHHDELSPRYRIRQRFREEAASLGWTKQRDFHAQAGRDLLATWGARVSQHTVALWQEGETPRHILEAMRRRVMSFTWEMDEAVLMQASRLATAWAEAEYGDLDRSFAGEHRFLVDWYQF